MKLNILDNPEIKSHISLISLENYHKMLETGIFSKKTELIEGVIFDKMTKSPEHSYYSNLIFELLFNIKPKETIIVRENPISLKNSEPEPDIMIIEGKLSDFKKHNPKTAFLVVEIAKTSLSLDREKIPLYAEANVLNYWILDIDNMKIEVYTNPFQTYYKQKKSYNKTESIPIFETSLDLKNLFEN